MHYRAMFDNEYLGAWDIPTGRNVAVTIERVEARELTSQRGKDHKPVVFFRGKQKGMVMNKTNCKAIAGMYGTDTTQWVGKPIAIYSTTTSAGGETVECLRVRPTPPQVRPARKAEPEPDLAVDHDGNLTVASREPGEEG